MSRPLKRLPRERFTQTLSPKAGLLAVLPNVFPVPVLFGEMGYLRIPPDTSTAMIAVIAVAICVDDSMHFM